MSSATYSVDNDDKYLKLCGLVLDGRFKVLRRIACGSYAEVHLACNISPQPNEPKVVVVKVLNLLFQQEQDADLDRTLIENIALEAQTLAGFQHDSIVRLYAFGHALDQAGRQFYYLVLEHVPGENLNRRCLNNPLTFAKTLDYAAQICVALSYAHTRGVIHRDVKPGNFMLTEDRSQVKMLDFGVARHLGRDNGLMTRVGTGLYAAPEHYSLSGVMGNKLTRAADVYGFAKTVYFMLCGRPPYEFRQRQITHLPAAISTEPWAAGMLRMLSRATSERAADRYQSVEEFYLALQSATELTEVSRRARPEAAHRKHLRIVVDVAQKQSDDDTIVKTSRRPSIASIHVLPSFLRNQSRAICNRISTALDDFRLNLGNLRLNLAVYTRTLPLKLLLHITLVAFICLILLLALPPLVRLLRPTTSTLPANRSATTNPDEKLMVASTDINIRFAPGKKSPKVGLVERDSKVHIIRFNSDRKWCEIEVLEHARAKEDPSSADRGWVYARALR